MTNSGKAASAVRGAGGLLWLLALAVFLIHMGTNGQYGFHRDELATVDDARFLAWGSLRTTDAIPAQCRWTFGRSPTDARSRRWRSRSCLCWPA
jgi:hypothetical protein